MRKIYLVFWLILIPGCFIFSTALGQWSSATLSQARADIAATSVGGKVLFAGGYLTDTYRPSDRVDIYDESTGQWTTAQLSQPRFRLSAVSSGNKAFFAGGSNTYTTSRVDIYDVATGRWDTTRLSQPRWAMACASAGGKVLFAGGLRNDFSSSNVVDIYDTNTGQWSVTQLPRLGGISGRGISVTTLDNKILFANEGLLDIYDVSNGKWTTSTFPTNRFGVTAATVGQLVILAGGVTSEAVGSSIVDIYNAASNEWYSAQLSEARAVVAAATLGNKAFFAGGFTRNYADRSSTVDIYNAATNKWTTSQLPHVKGGYKDLYSTIAAVSIGNKLFFAGDGTNQVDIYTEGVPSLTASALATTNQPISVTASGCEGIVNWDIKGGTGQALENRFIISQPGSYTLSASCTSNGIVSPFSPPLNLRILPAGFAITEVTKVTCQALNTSHTAYNVSFTPQYTGQNSSPISFSIVNEMLPTTDNPPYTLRLYVDNPTVTLVANQAGNAEARYRYNWLASCASGSSPNHPPVTSGIPNQNLTQNQAYFLDLKNYISDPDEQMISFTAQGLPAGLSLNGTLISGVPSQTGVSSVSVTALDPGGLTVNSNFLLVVNSVPVRFAITGVSTINCEKISAGERRVTFMPQYEGMTGEPISFSVVNEQAPTINPGPYRLRLFADNPTIALNAKQGNFVTSYQYNWLSACSSLARQGNPESDAGLNVKILGNPVNDQSVKIEIQGVPDQTVNLVLVDTQGKQVHQKYIEKATTSERVNLPVGNYKGLLLLNVQTRYERQQLKIIVH